MKKIMYFAMIVGILGTLTGCSSSNHEENSIYGTPLPQGDSHVEQYSVEKGYVPPAPPLK